MKSHRELWSGGNKQVGQLTLNRVSNREEVPGSDEKINKEEREKKKKKVFH